MTIVKDEKGQLMKLIPDRVCEYKGFVIKSMLTPYGTKIVRLLFPDDYKGKDIDTVIDNEVMALIAHVFNADTDTFIEIKDDRPYLYVFVGENVPDVPYTILPETGRAREVYADYDYDIDDERTDEFILKHYAPVEYTVDMAVNCAKRFVDCFLEKEAGIDNSDKYDHKVFTQIIEEFSSNPGKKFLPEKEIEYKGFKVETGVDVVGDRYIKIRFPKPGYHSMITANIDDVNTEITRLCNSTVTEFSDSCCFIAVGCNGLVMDESRLPIGLPDVDAAIKLYGDRIKPECVEQLWLHREDLLKGFRTIEYTPDTALNCAKRLIDSVFVTMSTRLDIRSKHKGFADMFEKNMKKVKRRGV